MLGRCFPVSLLALLSLGTTQSTASPLESGEMPGFTHDPNAAKDCTFWYDNDGAFDCEILTIAYSISLEDFLSWNPSLGLSCNLQEGQSYCVEAPAKTMTKPTPVPNPIPKLPASPSPSPSPKPSPTPTKPSNGITTPLPIQEGMIPSCDAFHLVAADDSCERVASENGVAVSDILKWNPAVGSDCRNLWVDTHVCVSVIGHEGKPSNGVETPSPIQPGMVDDCDKFHLVESEDACYAIAAEYGISLDEFLRWNPRVGGRACTGLWLDAWVCVGVIG